MQHTGKRSEKNTNYSDALVSPCQYIPLFSSVRSVSSASESTFAISKQVPREVNASSKDHLARQEAYQEADGACPGEARACLEAVVGEKTCLSSKTRAMNVEPAQTRLLRRLPPKLMRRLKLLERLTKHRC